MKRMLKKALNTLALFVLVASLLAATFSPAQAAGAEIPVNTIEDQFNTDVNHCSLREAIYSANHNYALPGCVAGSPTGTDIITLPPGYYKLTRTGPDEDDTQTGDLDILTNVNIIGTGYSLSSPNMSLVYAEAGFGDRIFEVKSPGANRVNAAFTNMRIKGGSVNGSTPNALRGGAGILVNSIQTDLGANAILTRVYLTGNSLSDTYSGGGMTIYNGSNVLIRDTTFDGNTAGNGGAIYNKGTLVMERSLLYANVGSASGGGLDNAGHATATITNSTIASNTSTSTIGGGAGISNSATLTLNHVTLANNTGTGILLQSNSNLNVQNSILSQPGDPNCSRISDTANFVSNGYNVIYGSVGVPVGYFTCDWIGSDSQGSDPLLSATLQESDFSPTKTYKFTSTESPAIDFVPLWNNCPITDQRGYGRPADGDDDSIVRCDAGAYEDGASLSVVYFPSTYR
jgi:CSLREA domain-containing protein